MVQIMPGFGAGKICGPAKSNPLTVSLTGFDVSVVSSGCGFFAAVAHDAATIAKNEINKKLKVIGGGLRFVATAAII